MRSQVCSVLHLLAVAVRGNEASRRMLVSGSETECEVLAKLTASRNTSVAAAAVALFSELADSPRAAETMLVAKGSLKVVPALVAAIVNHAARCG